MAPLFLPINIYPLDKGMYTPYLCAIIHSKIKCIMEKKQISNFSQFIGKRTDKINGRAHRKEDKFIFSYQCLDIDQVREANVCVLARSFIESRFYKAGRTFYCCLWIHDGRKTETNLTTSGMDRNGDKAGAFWSACHNAGIEIDPIYSGTQIESAIFEMALQLRPDGKFLITSAHG